jgi:hypothetical protein
MNRRTVAALTFLAGGAVVGTAHALPPGGVGRMTQGGLEGYAGADRRQNRNDSYNDRYNRGWSARQRELNEQDRQRPRTDPASTGGRNTGVSGSSGRGD